MGRCSREEREAGEEKMFSSLLFAIFTRTQKGATRHPRHYWERGCVRRTSRSNVPCIAGLNFKVRFSFYVSATGFQHSRAPARVPVARTQNLLLLGGCK